MANLGTVLLIAFLLFVGLYYFCKNSLGKIDDEFAILDIYLQKRQELIFKIIKIIEGYAENERTLLDEAMSLIKNDYVILNQERKIENNIRLEEKIVELVKIIRQHPKLRDSEGFSKLQEELEKTEENISEIRKKYNDLVKKYNSLAKNPPLDSILKAFKLKDAKYYDINKELAEQYQVWFK